MKLAEIINLIEKAAKMNNTKKKPYEEVKIEES